MLDASRLATLFRDPREITGNEWKASRNHGAVAAASCGNLVRVLKIFIGVMMLDTWTRYIVPRSEENNRKWAKGKQEPRCSCACKNPLVPVHSKRSSAPRGVTAETIQWRCCMHILQHDNIQQEKKEGHELRTFQRTSNHSPELRIVSGSNSFLG